MEDLLTVKCALSAAGAVTVTKAVGVEVKIPIAPRSGEPCTAADHAVAALRASHGVNLVLGSDVLATLTFSGDVLPTLGRFRQLCGDALHGPDDSTELTRGCVIKGYLPDNSCHTIATLTTTSESAAAWAWAFSELHRRAQNEGFSGFRASLLLHDCVPSVFAGVAYVLPCITSHHYCCYHSKSAFEKRVNNVIVSDSDVMDSDLREGVLARSISLSTALTRQRERIVHAWNLIILSTNIAGAALLLQGFLERYAGNQKLMKVLCTAPYNDLDAILMCLSTSSRCIDANCELFMRLVRQLQRGAQGARCKMKNFGGVVLLLAHAYFRSLASESDRDFRVGRSVKRRKPMPAAAVATPPPPPSSHVAASSSALPRDPQQLTLPRLGALASLASASPAVLHARPRGELHAIFQATAECAAPSASNFERNFRDLAATGRGTFTFSELLKNFKSGAYIVSSADAVAFKAALQRAQEEAEQELQEYLKECARDPAEAFSESAAAARVPSPPPPAAAAFSSSPMIAPQDHLFHLLSQRKISATANANRVKRHQPEASAQVFFSLKLPPLDEYRAVGRPVPGSKEMRSTVAAPVAGQRVPVPAHAQVAIARAWAALPPTATVLFGRIDDLYLRTAAVMRSEGNEEVAWSAPTRRVAVGVALAGSAIVAALERGR